MHKESFDLMGYFVKKYLDKNQNLEILDVGSYDVNGSYKPLFKNTKWNYYGLDLAEGPNVDYVSKSAYDFNLERKFDVVISGNCLEHVEAPWKWIKEVEKVTKDGGIVCIITPFSIGQHRHPVDCWRILPDAYKYLLEKESNYTVMESKLNKLPKEYRFFNRRPKLKWILGLFPTKLKKALSYTPIQDTYVIARKNANI